MKSLNSVAISAIWATALLLATCSREVEPFGICGEGPSPQPPPGYDLTVVSQLDNHYHHIQFLDDLNGFLLGSNPVGGYTKIQKTTDGGQTWTELLAGNSYHPISLAFRNSQEGLLTIHDITGCPSSCAHKTVVVRTVDGGGTWTPITIPDVSGILYNVTFDAQGKAYGNLNGHSIIVSEDLGETWETSFTSPDLEVQYVNFIYETFNDKLYIAGRNGKIIKIDNQGNLLEVIETGQTHIRRLTVVDEEYLLLDTFSHLLASSDGGVTWTTLYARNAYVLDWTTSGEGLAILNKSYCGDNPSQLDVIGVTSDGGQNWVFGDDSGNLGTYFGDSQKMNDGSTLLTIDDKLLRLTKQ